MQKPINVLVFGSTGAGKTSLCNTITEENRPVSSSAKGVTFQSYTYKPFNLNGRECVITDTVGLNESNKGTVPSKDALKALMVLLKGSKEGYNLLVHVMRGPRITKAEHDNYQFFVNTISQNKIPTILVATGCENVSPMKQWAIDNAHSFQDEKLIYKDIVAACFAEGGPLEPIYSELRSESRSMLEESIQAHAAFKPIKIYDSNKSLISTMVRVWNEFCQWAGVQSLLVNTNKALKELLIRFGFSNQEATNLAEEL